MYLLGHPNICWTNSIWPQWDASRKGPASSSCYDNLILLFMVWTYWRYDSIPDGRAPRLGIGTCPPVGLPRRNIYTHTHTHNLPWTPWESTGHSLLQIHGFTDEGELVVSLFKIQKCYLYTQLTWITSQCLVPSQLLQNSSSYFQIVFPEEQRRHQIHFFLVYEVSGT